MNERTDAADRVAGRAAPLYRLRTAPAGLVLTGGGARAAYQIGVLKGVAGLLYEFVDDRAGLRQPVELEAVSEAFLAATIATEDSSFFTNPGVSFTGLARAVVENVNPFSDGFFDGPGGSSITQQLIKNVYIPFEERASRSIDRKLKETTYAIELTRRYSKEQILEWYKSVRPKGGWPPVRPHKRAANGGAKARSSARK